MSRKRNEKTKSTKILRILFLFIKITATCSSTVSSQSSCSLASRPCDISEMKYRLEKVVDLTGKVIETLNDGTDSPNCPVRPEDCEAVYRCGSKSSGVYTVWPWNRILTGSIQVYCDMETEGGGWTVVQRRGNFGRSKDYFYNWNMYKEGFGDISQDFWIGNDLLFSFTNQKLYSLRFDLRDLEGESRWAMYDKFWVESEDHNYTLNVQGYTGNAGDSFSVHNRRQFSTKDRDNDLMPEEHCALRYKGAWWYAGCHHSNLNGFYLNGTHASFADGIEWKSWRGYNYSLPFTEMKIRPIFFKIYKDEVETKIPL